MAYEDVQKNIKSKYSSTDRPVPTQVRMALPSEWEGRLEGGGELCTPSASMQVWQALDKAVFTTGNYR